MVHGGHQLNWALDDPTSKGKVMARRCRNAGKPKEKHELEPTVLCLTMVDLATRWIEVICITVKDSRLVALVFDCEWLSRYTRPLHCIHDQGSQIMGVEFQELLTFYGIESVPITVCNRTANAILERSHQVIGSK